MKLIITGASGFVGRAVMHEAMGGGHEVLALTRNGNDFDGMFNELSILELLLEPEICECYDAVIHCAGLAHNKNSSDNLSESQAMFINNTLLTLDLVEAVFKHSEAKFVFLSSLAVYGLSSSPLAIDEKTDLSPTTFYGKSKLEAERGIRVLAAIYDKQYTIIRPPLIYGLNAPANFGLLIRLAHTALPLPFARARAGRSVVGVRNLAAFIILACQDNRANGENFVIADNEPHSLRDIITSLRHGHGNLFPLPVKWMASILSVIGRHKLAEQLFYSLIVDWKHAKNKLLWTPKYTFQQNMDS